MATYYSELRPAYTGEATYTVVITIDGSGSIAGQGFDGILTDPGGTVVADAISVEVADPDGRTITVTIDGQDDPGDYRFVIRRTDDDSNAVVALGVLDINDPVS